MLSPDASFWRMWARAFVCAVLGCLFLLAHRPAQAATMRASYYGAESGSFNADGSRFNPMGFTAANRTLPFGTRLQACFHGCVVVTVRDRGPAAWTGRLLDLSHGAARAIGMEHVGVANIDVTILRRGVVEPRARRLRAAGRRSHHQHRHHRRR